MRCRVGSSCSWLGLGYLPADAQLQFNRRPDQPELPGIHIDNALSALLPEYSYGSRDAIFTPRDGFYFFPSMALFSPKLGGEEEFQWLSLFTMAFWPVTEVVTIGAAVGSVTSSGDTPIYLRPYTQVRGAPGCGRS